MGNVLSCVGINQPKHPGVPYTGDRNVHRPERRSVHEAPRQRPTHLAVPEPWHAVQGTTPSTNTAPSSNNINNNHHHKELAVDVSPAATHFGMIQQHVEQQAAQAQQQMVEGAAASAAGPSRRASGEFDEDEESPPEPIFSWTRGKLIGAGAFGKVYVALNNKTGEIIAVKQVGLTREEALKGRVAEHIKALEAEVNVLRQLRNENIVQYLGTERTEDCLNIFLEYVPGGSIASLIEKFGPLQETVVRIYARQILKGLEYLHQKKIMHRDIKGANILVDKKGCVKLADFGASKKIEDLATMGSGAKSIRGTPYWMAPEVIKQTGHGRPADIWSLGCVVIEMATGKPPWSNCHTQVAAMFHIASTREPPPLPAFLSAECKDFLLLCFNRVPKERPNATRLLKHPFVANVLAPAAAVTAASLPAALQVVPLAPPSLPSASTLPPAPAGPRQLLGLRASRSPPSPIKEEATNNRPMPHCSRTTGPMCSAAVGKGAYAQAASRSNLGGLPSRLASGAPATQLQHMLPPLPQPPKAAAVPMPSAAVMSRGSQSLRHAQAQQRSSAGSGGLVPPHALAPADVGLISSPQIPAAPSPPPPPASLPQEPPQASPAGRRAPPPQAEAACVGLEHLAAYVPPPPLAQQPLSPPPSARQVMMSLDYNPMEEPSWLPSRAVPHGFFNRPLDAIRASGEDDVSSVHSSPRCVKVAGSMGDSPRMRDQAPAPATPAGSASRLNTKLGRDDGEHELLDVAAGVDQPPHCTTSGMDPCDPCDPTGRLAWRDTTCPPSASVGAPPRPTTAASRPGHSRQSSHGGGLAGGVGDALPTFFDSEPAGASPGVDPARASKMQRWRDELLLEVEHKRQEAKAARARVGVRAQ